MTRGAATVALRVRPASIVEDEARRANANDLLRSMRSIRSVQPVGVPPGAIAGYLRLPILLSGVIEGDQWLRLERLGVARSYPSTLDAVPALRASMVSSGHGWPGARLLAERLVTLPTHSRTAGGDRAMIGNVLAGSLPHDTAS